MVKPLQTAEFIEKRDKRRKTIVGIVIITLLLLSTAGFALNGIGTGFQNDKVNTPANGPTYNGQYWVYTLSGQQFYFTYKKDETNATNLDFQKTFADFAGKDLYIDTASPAVYSEIGTNMGRFVNKLQEACYGHCERDLPEKNCADNLISFKDSSTESITEQENCTFIEGDLKTVVAFLYRVLGVNQI